MRLTILGSGTPRPNPRRASSSYLLEIGDDRLLLDHGYGSGDRLLQAGIDPRDISHVFLSHHHYDHIGDLPRLLLTRWDQQRGPHREISVYGPPPLRTIVDHLIGQQSAFAPDIKARIDSPISRDLYAQRGGTGVRAWPEPIVGELQPGDSVDTDGWTLTTAEAIHCPGDLACLAFRIDANGHSIVYSGDSGPSAPLAQLAQGCDLLVHMCSRMSDDGATPAVAESSLGHLELAELAAGADVGKLVLTHIQHLEDDTNRTRTLAEIGEIYDGDIVVAADLMTLTVGKPALTEATG